MKTKVLMSRTTPDGFKLEDLLVDVIEDLRLKNKWLDESSGLPTENEQVNNLVWNHNTHIMNLLATAVYLQNVTMSQIEMYKNETV